MGKQLGSKRKHGPQRRLAKKLNHVKGHLENLKKHHLEKEIARLDNLQVHADYQEQTDAERAKLAALVEGADSLIAWIDGKCEPRQRVRHRAGPSIKLAKAEV